MIPKWSIGSYHVKSSLSQNKGQRETVTNLVKVCWVSVCLSPVGHWEEIGVLRDNTFNSVLFPWVWAPRIDYHYYYISIIYDGVR